MTADLFLFDIDGTLIRSFLREGAGRARYDDVEVLDGRMRKLKRLRDQGRDIALVTNQGGVAMGYQDPPQVCRKLAAVWEALGLDLVGAICCGPDEYRDVSGLPIRFDAEDGVPIFAYVAFHHPNARRDRWRRDTDWRKPGGGMITAARRDVGAPQNRVLFVGDMDSDREAAEAAGVRYEDAVDFFGSGEPK